MIHILKSFAAKMWFAFALLVILGGIFMGGARLLLPIAAEYRDEVEELASRELGQKVQIGEIKTGWRGYGPELRLHNVQLTNPETGQTTLRLSEVRIGIGILDSLFNGAITPRQITFYRTRLLIKRRSDGSVVLAGLENIEEGNDDSSAVFLIPFRIGLKQSEIYWENQSIGGDPVKFTDVDFTISNGKNRHQVEASMRLPGKDGGSMRLVADIKGAVQQSNAWSGEIYLSGDRLALSTIFKDRMPEGSAFESGKAKIELWSKWINGRLSTMEGYGNLDRLKMVSNRKVGDNPIEPLEIEHAGGRFKWQRNRDSWQIDVADIEFRRNGRAWPKANLSLLNRYDQEGNMQLLSGIGFMRTEDILAIVRMFPLPSKNIDNLIHTLKPQADIRSMQFRFQETQQGHVWSARGRLEDVSLDPWHKWPEIRKLNASFWLDQDQGTAELGSRELTVNFPNLFRDAIHVQDLSGRLHWSRTEDDGWLVQSRKIIANNRDIKTQTRLRLNIPQDQSKSLTLDLQTDFRDGDASTTSRYLPTGIMDKEVVDWLDKSIISGKVPEGSAVFRGPLADFPFYKDTGHFEVLFNVSDLILDYEPGWPRIEKLAAEVRFHNNSLAIRDGSGTMLNSRLNNLYARIDDLENASPLRITGSASGPLHDEIKLLTETPLSKKFGETASKLTAKGHAKLNTKLTIPLDKGDYAVDGDLIFDNASINLDNSKFPLRNIEGKLSFSDNGVKAQGIKAKMLGEEITLDITPIEDKGAALIKAQASVSGAELDKQFPGLGLDLLQGNSKWAVQFEVPSLSKNQGRITINQITASSDLVGTAIDMPAPIGKSKKQKSPIQIATTTSSGTTQQLRINYANVMNTSLQLSRAKTGDMVLERGSLVFGGSNTIAPKAKQLILSGSLNHLDLNPWLSYLQTDGKQTLPEIKGDNLQFGKLKIGDTTLEDVRLSFTENNNSIDLDVRSSIIDGKIKASLPLKSKPVVANLDKLSLKIDPTDTSNDKTPDSEWTDPRTLPALSLTSKNTLINGANLGPLNFTSTSIPEGLRLDNVKFSSDRLTLNANGRWVAQNKKTKTSLRLNMKTDSLGKLLTILGFDPGLKEAPAKVEADLVWSGNPRQFNKTDVTGQIEMRIDEGRFLEVNPGLGRIFGLLNVSALTRRLTMDFSDTFKKGFSFDKAEGTFNLDHGDAYTNDLRIEGPAGTIDISGRTGLVTQDLDQLVAITPSVSTTIPVAGALAGGPAVGVALVLAQKIFGKTVDKVSTTKYTVTGSWDNPNIEKLNLNNPAP